MLIPKEKIVPASNQAYVAIFEGARGRQLAIGDTNPGQEFRLFWSELRALGGCRSVTVFRAEASATYMFEPGSWGIDWTTVKEVGLIASLLSFIIGLEGFLTATPASVTNGPRLEWEELLNVLQTKLRADIHLRKRLKRNPKLFTQLASARSMKSLCACLNR